MYIFTFNAIKFPFFGCVQGIRFSAQLSIFGSSVLTPIHSALIQWTRFDLHFYAPQHSHFHCGCETRKRNHIKGETIIQKPYIMRSIIQCWKAFRSSQWFGISGLWCNIFKYMEISSAVTSIDFEVHYSKTGLNNFSTFISSWHGFVCTWFDTFRA